MTQFDSKDTTVVDNGALYDIEVRTRGPLEPAVAQCKNDPHCPEVSIAFGDWDAVRRLAAELHRVYAQHAATVPDWHDYVDVVHGPGYYRLADGRVVVITEFRHDYARKFSIKDVHAWAGRIINRDGSVDEANFTPSGRSHSAAGRPGMLDIVGPVQGFNAKV